MLIPEQYNIIWGTSWISLYPSILAFVNNKYDLSLLTSIVFSTSLLYWKNPINSWRRHLDIVAVRTTLLYQIYYANKEKN